MFLYIRSREEKVTRFATGETIGKAIAMIIASADNIPSFDQACQLAGMHQKADSDVWISPSGREMSKENAYLSY